MILRVLAKVLFLEIILLTGIVLLAMASPTLGSTVRPIHVLLFVACNWFIIISLNIWYNVLLEQVKRKIDNI